MNSRRIRSIDQRVAVSLVYVAALFMSIMDTTIVNVALPTIGRELHASSGSIGVVVSGYLVSLAVVIPASGWIGDRFGGRRTLLVAISTFTIASALCAVATDLPQLVASRILQGIGGGMLTPIGMAMVFRVFPPSDRVRLASIMMIPTSVAPAFGPLLGGWLVTDFSWRWVFLINLPIGLTTLIFGFLYVEDHVEPAPGRFDLAGFVLAGAGLGALMYGITQGPERGWTKPAVLLTIILGSALLAGMVRVELSRDDPMVDLRQLLDRPFRTSTFLVIFLNMSFSGILLLVPLYLQNGRDLQASASGLATFPEAIGVVLGAQVVSRLLYALLGPRVLIAAGFGGMAVVTAFMALSGANTSLWWMRLLMFSAGFVMPSINISVQATAFASITPAATGRASTLFVATRQLSSALGVVLLSAVLLAVGTTRRVGDQTVAHLAAYHVAFLVAAGVSVAGAVIAYLTVDDRAAAETMTRRHRRSESASAAN